MNRLHNARNLVAALLISALGASGAWAQASEMSSGEIRKVDKEAGKVTIKHGEIKNLDMPGMTMIFTAKEKSLLDKVQPGDKVKFAVINDGGKMVVTDIQTVK